MSYSQQNTDFLDVANAMSRDGQKQIKIVLEQSTNTFYTIDDDSNLLPIQSNEWTELIVPITSAQTLTCYTTPVDVLPEPGVDNYYEYEGFLEYTYGGLPYTDGLFGIGEDTDGSKGFIGLSDSDFLVNVDVNAVMGFSNKKSVSSVNPFTYTNKKVVFTNNPNVNEPKNASDGNGTFNIIIKYKIKTIR